MTIDAASKKPLSSFSSPPSEKCSYHFYLIIKQPVSSVALKFPQIIDRPNLPICTLTLPK